MRLTRCLLRYGGTYLTVGSNASLAKASGKSRAKKCVSGVGFEPTPSIEDQKSHLIPYRGIRHGLESGALDHSANLTVWQVDLKLPVSNRSTQAPPPTGKQCTPRGTPGNPGP